ncbi:MAG: cation:dicarboxylase symporter family transporter [Candidatus Obscuribacterales bacterium]|nr:cation:dicarboxylase symporter family transporter [Candidatus Obscuribacterales bacterium]
MRNFGLTAQIFVGLVVGILVGWLAPEFGKSLHVVADVFLHLVKSIIAPLVFATLVVGIAGHENLKSVGRLGLKSMIYFEVVTTFALAIGLLVANICRPGAGVALNTTTAGDAAALAAKQPQLADIITHTFPSSVVDAMARGDVLQIVVFSILFASAVSAVKAEPVLKLCESLSEVMFKYTGYVMRLAPYGVAGAMAATVGQHGLTVLLDLGKLVGTLYLALFLFALVVLLPVALIARVPIKDFIGAVKEPVILAFSTTSSEAALPKALVAMEKLGVPRNVVSFVLPVGYTFNLDGTTLYLSLAATFVAQAAGVSMSIEQQVMMMLTLMLTSKGVAAVPRASLVILAGTLASFNLPLAGIALILGVDTLMDMARTAVNVLGNCLASVVMARWEGVFRQPGWEANAKVGAAALELEPAPATAYSNPLASTAFSDPDAQPSALQEHTENQKAEHMLKV